MRRMFCTTRGRAGVWLAASWIGLAPWSRALAQPDDRALATSVDHFLTTWLVKRDAESAVRDSVTQTLNDERFVPAQWYSASEYYEKFDYDGKRRPRPLASKEFARRMTDYLNSLVPPGTSLPSGSVRQLLGPFSVEAVRTNPDLARLLARQEPRQLPNLPAIAYSVRGWGDISWTASGTVGLHTGLSERVASGNMLQAVIAHPVTRTAEPPPLLFMLWANEREPGTWKLWALELIPQR